MSFIENLTSDKVIPEEKLQEICRNPVVDEAIFLASPDLFNQMHEWLNGKLKDREKIEKLHYALMRYILRMSTRSTPFGLFAGFNVGEWVGETKVELPMQEDYTRHTRLDMNYLCALAQDLAKHPVIKEKIKFYPNSSVYAVGDQLRYVEYRYKNTRRTHHIVAVDNSEYLQRVLKTASGGAFLKDLAELLVEEEITYEEARDFIEELVNSQVLVNELEPAITGPEFLDQILVVLQGIPGIDEIRDTIMDTQRLLQEIDNSKIGTTLSYYSRIADVLKPLGTTFEMKFLFQTDMVKPVHICSLEQNIVEDVLEAMEVLNKLTPRGGANTLTQFRDAFFDRYETKEIPLLQALDTEAGIGYRQGSDAGDIAPLVDDLALPSTGTPSQDIRWTPLYTMLFKKYREALANQKYEVELTPEDIKSFQADWNDLPDTLSAMVQVVEGNGIDNDGKPTRPKILLTGLGGSGAGNLLGRFCHADQATDRFVKEITKKEEELNPDKILAEIIHLPESRVGNVLIRPVLRPHEIPYLAKAAVDKECHVKVEDIMISVKGNRIILRSKQLNKEIIPHLTNAHNYSYNALPVYHLLADLQTQNLRGGVGFNWGPLSNEYDFLPRMTYKNFIFSPATWTIIKTEIADLLKINDDIELIEKTNQWREKRRIPAYVLLSDSDNKLFLNLANAMCIKTLFSVVHNRPGFQLSEFLFNPDNAVVKSNEGVFTNEFVFCFYFTGKRDSRTALEPAPVEENEDEQAPLPENLYNMDV